MPKIVNHEERRVELARAVWAVVRRDGINAASIRAVAAEAGRTYGYVSHYFKKRDDLLAFAYKLALQQELDRPPDDESADALERLIGELLRALPRDDEVDVEIRIWLGFMGRVADDPSLAESVRAEHQAYHAKVRSLVKESYATGLLKTSGDLMEIAEYVLVFVDGLGVVSAVDPQTYTREYREACLRRYLAALGWPTRMRATRRRAAST